MLSLFILIPLLLLLIFNLPLGSAFRKSQFPVLIVLFLLQCLMSLYISDQAWTAKSGPDSLLGLNLHLDDLSRVFLLSAAIVMLASLFTGQAAIKDERHKFNFYSILLIGLAGINGTMLMTDLFSAYVYIEIIALSSFLLIALRQERDALEGAFKYIVLSAIAGIFILGGMALLILYASSTSFEDLFRACQQNAKSPLLLISIAALLGGLFIKSGVVPFHGWVPDAYSSAPTASGVYLAGIATKASGLYLILRLYFKVLTPFHFLNQTFMAIGLITVIIGAFAALGQQQMKRLLAYSSISQLGYILLGIGCGTALGVVGAVFHIFNHALFKSLLFINVAAVEEQTGTSDMNKLSGVSQRMPYTGLTSAIASLSVAGVPPLSGFWSKLIIILALWQAGHQWYAALAVLLSLITLAYMTLMHRRVFFGKIAESFQHIHETGMMLMIPQVILAGLIVITGLLFYLVINVFMPIGNLLSHRGI